MTRGFDPLYITLILSISLILIISFTNHAYALENRISDVIKRVCPSFDNSGSIEKEVLKIIKSCLLQSQNPLPTSLLHNLNKSILNLVAANMSKSIAHVTVTDLTDGSSNTFTLTDRVLRDEQYVIPNGHQYNIKVKTSFADTIVSFIGDCKVDNDPKSCTGIMENPIQEVSFVVGR